MPEIRVQDEQGTIHVFPDGTKPEEIEQAMSAKFSAQPSWYSAAGLKAKGYELGESLAQSLPAAGAMIGATIGAGAGTGAAPGPGTIAGTVGGAGMGGMAGEAGKQLLRNLLGFENPLTYGQQAADITKQGVTQAAVQGLSEALPFAANPLRKAALTQYERALAPTTVQNKAITQKIAPEMIQKGVYGSLEGMQGQAQAQAAALVPKLDAAIDAIPDDELAVLLKKYESPAIPLGTEKEISQGLAQKRAQEQIGSMASTLPSGVLKPNPIVEDIGTQAGALPANKLFGPKAGTGLELGVIPGPLHGALRDTSQALESLKQNYIVDGKIANPTAVSAIQGVQDIVSQFGNSVSPQSIRKLRKIFDDPVAKAGGFVGNDLSGRYTLLAQEAAGNSLRKLLANASPDVAALNHEMNFWLNVERVTSASAQRQTGQSGGLLKIFTPLAAAGAGAGIGYEMGAHAGLESAGAVVLTGLATKIVRSAAWRTASAVTKNALADALARGDVGQVAALAARFGVAAGTMPADNTQGGPPTQQGQQ